MAYHTITDRAIGRNVTPTLQNIVNGNIIVGYSDKRSVVDALMQDLKEGGIAKNWNERERVLALQALKTLGRATEGCDSIFAEEILDDTLRYSLSTDEEASTDGMSNGTELDEIVPPLVIVLTNIASAGGEAKAALKARLLPDDVDRSQPLEKGNTFSARLIRRMTSIRFPQIRETVSQLLYIVCDEDAALLTRHVGYGNAAGFLMNRNLGMPASMQGGGGGEEEEEENENENEEEVEELPSPTSGPSSSARQARRFSSASAVNPITGAYYPDPSAIRTAMADMTEEEKEEEAGKLLDMFDKLRRTGVMEVRNPALEAGLRQRERDRYYEEQERREREDEDDGDD
ncbi:hypothetical protein BGZ52_002470 [Haplosporangium bisporale]|nr:hypothetical protein BGZ52_002470 [Haplosporangium bisporale]